MNKQRRRLSAWEHYLAKEINIEFKACLYFFCFLFFYSVVRLCGGSREADIFHLAQMILSTYFMGWLQTYLLSDFDEGERLGVRELSYMVLCSGVYAGIAWLFRWFDRSLWAGLVFFAYVMAVYLCAFFVYRSRRRLEEKLLNEELREFQERGGQGAKRD